MRREPLEEFPRRARRAAPVCRSRRCATLTGPAPTASPSSPPRRGSSSEFILLMSDHLFDPAILRDMIAADRGGAALTLAADFAVDNPLLDLDDATKIELAKAGGSPASARPCRATTPSTPASSSPARPCSTRSRQPRRRRHRLAVRRGPGAGRCGPGLRLGLRRPLVARRRRRGRLREGGGGASLRALSGRGARVSGPPHPFDIGPRLGRRFLGRLARLVEARAEAEAVGARLEPRLHVAGADAADDEQRHLVGSTARCALTIAGAAPSAGNSFSPVAPARSAAKASDGVKKPGSDTSPAAAPPRSPARRCWARR